MQHVYISVYVSLLFAGAACSKIDAKQKIQEDSDVEKRQVQVAVMIVGVKLKVDQGGTEASFIQTHAATNTIQMMTGDDAEYQHPNKTAYQHPALLSFDPKILHAFGETDVWKNTKTKMLSSLAQFAHVDTYVCVDQAAGLLVPQEVAEVFQYPALGQVERASECVRKVQQTGKHYAWFVKTRPDFLSFGNWPDVTKFNPDYVYSRFRTLSGISDVTTHALSWQACEGHCYEKGHGYVNDDQLVVASSKIIDHVFNQGSPATLPPLGSFADYPLDNTAEGQFTKRLIANHLLTMPLNVLGCPLETFAPGSQCEKNYPCRSTPTQINCTGTGAVALAEIHRRMRAAGR